MANRTSSTRMVVSSDSSGMLGIFWMMEVSAGPDLLYNSSKLSFHLFFTSLLPVSTFPSLSLMQDIDVERPLVMLLIVE